MKKLLIVLLALTLALPLFPSAEAAGEGPEVFFSGGFEYILLLDGTAQITWYSGSGGALRIPAELDGHAVTGIGEYAFSGCDSLRSVTIPDGVTDIGANPFMNCAGLEIIVSPDHPSLTVVDGALINRPDMRLICDPRAFTAGTYAIPQGIRIIGDRAFHGCGSLKSVTIPEGVTAIGDEAFSRCTGLTSVTVPDSVTAVGADPFVYCYALEEIAVSPMHPCLEVIDGVLFSRPDRRLVCYPCAFTAETYAIPQGTDIIGDSAFAFCGSLTSVTIPEGVTAIGDSAFYHCDSLASVTIPDGVTAIGDHAFYGCYDLTSVTVPDSVTAVGADPFAYCYALEEIAVSPEHPFLEVIDGVLFSRPDRRLVCYPGALEAQTYAIPQGTEIIGDHAFAGCDILTWVRIPEGVTVIGDYAFYDCDGLTSVTIPEGVTAVGDSVFAWCDGLTSVTIPEGVTAIGDSMFAGCESLTSVTIPEGVTAIGDDAFSDCARLRSVTLPDSVTSIGTAPFAFCAALEEIAVSPEHPCLEVIDGVLFSRPDRRLVCCPGALAAEAYAIPQGTEIIGAFAFTDCDRLTTVTVPEGVTVIGERAFYECGGLTTVTIPEGAAAIGDFAFYVCDRLTSVTVPDSVTFIGQYAFDYCPDLTLTVGRGSFAEQYFRDNGLAYIYPDGSNPNG